MVQRDFAAFIAGILVGIASADFFIRYLIPASTGILIMLAIIVYAFRGVARFPVEFFAGFGLGVGLKTGIPLSQPL